LLAELKLTYRGSKGPNLLELDRDNWITTELYWYDTSPNYVQDFKSYAWLRDIKMYVWQPHLDVNSFPPQKAVIALSGKKAQTGETHQTRDMVILLRPTFASVSRLPASFRYMRQAHSSLTLEEETLTSIFCLYEVILSDTRKYVKDLLMEVATLVCQ
jgi:hypothetical protein